MSGEPDFEVSVERRDPRTVVAARGELDLATADGLAATLRLELASAPVLLDLSALTFMDSSGVRLLDAVNRDLVREGWDLLIGARMESSVRQVLAMTGMLTVLPMGDDRHA